MKLRLWFLRPALLSRILLFAFIVTVMLMTVVFFANGIAAGAESWSWPGYPDKGALGTYLMSRHNYKQAQLEQWTFNQWREVHDKIQNQNRTKGYVIEHVPGLVDMGLSRGCGNPACVMCYGYDRRVPAWDTSLQQVAPPVQPPPVQKLPREPVLIQTESAHKPAAQAPTPQWVVDEALKFADVKKTDHVCDLGSGDGRVIVTAAKTYGCRATGVERDAAQYIASKDAAKGLPVHVIHGDILDAKDLSEIDVVYMYLYPELIKKHIPLLSTLKEGSRIVTYFHEIPDLLADRSLTIQAEDGKHTLYLLTVKHDTFDAIMHDTKSDDDKQQ